MILSADPNNGQHYRSNFEDAEITLDGQPVDCFEADTVAGSAKCFKRNSDRSLVFADAGQTQPAYEMRRGKVRIKVAMIAPERSCDLAKLRRSKWWKKL